MCSLKMEVMKMMDVEVTNVHRLDGDGATKAFCDIIVSKTIAIKGIRVIEGSNGLFIGMPNKQGKDGKWYESVKPVNKEIKEALNGVILKAFNG
ncbi:MAG: septation protein SpoVG family protein [Candidatus Omnitrophota bacterium]|nr:septation protein SpoVG family protein [Candidatus Omnitrophota bacterium]